jgi:hypothetical protein
MSIKKVKFNQLYRLWIRGPNSSYCIVRFVGRKDLSEEVIYSIERADLWTTPKRVYVMRVSQGNFEDHWFQSLTEVKTEKEKTLIALKTGLSEKIIL